MTYEILRLKEFFFLAFHEEGKLNDLNLTRGEALMGVSPDAKPEGVKPVFFLAKSMKEKLQPIGLKGSKRKKKNTA